MGFWLILLTILKIIGIIIASVLVLLLLIVSLVLFVPVRYSGEVGFKGKPDISVRVTYLLKMISARFEMHEGNQEFVIRIFGIRLGRRKNKKRKSRLRDRKNRKNRKSRKKSESVVINEADNTADSDYVEITTETFEEAAPDEFGPAIKSDKKNKKNISKKAKGIYNNLSSKIKNINEEINNQGNRRAFRVVKDALAGIKASIGASEAFVNDVWNQMFGKTEINFNTSNGKLEIGRGSTITSTNYDTFGNTWKNYYSPSLGMSATALKTGSGFSLVSGSNGETTVNLNTGDTIAQNQNNFWNNLNDALPAIQGLLGTVLNMLQQTLSPYQMSPSQVGDGWVTPSNNQSNNITTALILTGIVGGAVLLSDDKKRK